MTSGARSSNLRLDLDPAQRADEAAKRIHSALLAAILANEEGARRGTDPDRLHDFRVAVRRTRSGLGQIKRVFPRTTVRRFAAGFSRLGRATGPARDLDVLLLALPAYRARLPAGERSFLDPIEAEARRLHRAARRGVVRALDSARYRALIAAWREFLAAPVPRRTTLANARRPIAAVAGERIERCYRRVIERGRPIDDASPAEAVHRLRIAGKKLRYLLEFFRSLYPPADLEPAVKELKKLQDRLGDFNDLAVQQEIVGRLAAGAARAGRATPGTPEATDRLLRQLASRQAATRAGLGRCFARFDAAANRRRFARLLRPL